MKHPAPRPADDRPLRELTRILLLHPIRFAWIGLAGLIQHATGLAVPLLLALLIGDALDRPDIPAGSWWALGAAILLAAAAAWWQLHISHDWAFRLLEQLRLRVYDGIARLAPARHGGKRTGELATTARDDVDTTELFFVHIVADAVGAVLTAGAAVAALTILTPPLALAMLTAGLVMGIVPFLLARRQAPLAAEIRSATGAGNAALMDSLHGLRELTLFRAASAQLAGLADRDRHLARLQRAHARRAGLSAAIVQLAVGAVALATLVLLAGAVADGTVAPEIAPVLFVLATAPLVPIAAIAGTAAGLDAIREASRRVLALIHAASPIGDHGTRTPAFEAAPTITLTDVALDYGDGRGPSLDGVTAAIQPGETVALVGASGAGKTSIANLLLRFWDPTRGRIDLDGVPLTDMPAEHVRALIAAVPQDVHVFEGTIADNIRLGRPDATDAEVEQAARRAAAHEFMDTLPDGYDTACEPGGENLSGGQRQRLAIARALLTGAPILLLDEAVSNLDGENEDAVAATLAGLRADHTIVVIAHRPSTIRAADRVLLLESGRIAATGSHETLQADSRYRELVGSAR